MSSFLPSVDNLSYNVKDVHNILVVPVFGQNKEIDDIK